jgi:hypothetical protein
MVAGALLRQLADGSCCYADEMSSGPKNHRRRRFILLLLLLLGGTGTVVLTGRLSPSPGPQAPETVEPANASDVAASPADGGSDAIEVPNGSSNRRDDHAEGSVRILVTDLEGNPLADAELRIRRRGDGGPSISMSAPQPPGRFRTSLAAGEWVVQVKSATHLPQEIVARVEPRQETVVDVRLDPGLWIEGMLKIRGSGPARNARVSVKGPAGTERGRSDRFGRFRLGPLSPGDWELSATGRGFLRFSMTVAVRAGAGGNLGEVTLEPGRPLRGVVLDGDGTPVAQARVSVKGASWTRTKADGSFRFSAVSPRGVKLQIRAEGYLPLEAPVGADEMPGPVRLELSRGGLVRAVYRDGEGKAVASVLVEARDAAGEWVDSAWTDDEGRFDLRLPPGRYRLREEDARAVLADVTLAEGDIVDLELAR